jgi:hypothetical protein
MATFYLLPPRPIVVGHFQAFLGSLFPGLSWPKGLAPDLLDEAARAQADVYVVYQEELAEDADPATALVRDFGAQSGDEVVQVQPAAGHMSETARWKLPGLKAR